MRWATSQAAAPDATEPPEQVNFEELQARIALVGSKGVQQAWGALDEAFRPYWMTHVAAVNAHAALLDPDNEDDKAFHESNGLRDALGVVVGKSRDCQTKLAEAMRVPLHP